MDVTTFKDLLELISNDLSISIIATLIHTAITLISVAISIYFSWCTREKAAGKLIIKIEKIIRNRIAGGGKKQNDFYERYKSVYGLMFERRMKEAHFVSISFTIFLVTYITISFTMKQIIDQKIIYITILLLLLPWLKLFLNAFRIKNGYLGNSEYEIRELLSYIIAEASDDDLNDENGPRKLIDLGEFNLEKASKYEVNSKGSYAKDRGLHHA